MKTTSNNRPRVSTLAALGIALTALAAGCTIDAQPTTDRAIAISDAETCVTLWAGQTIDAGEVCVAIDNTVDTSAECGPEATGVMEVTYNTTDGWTLVEAHLAAGDELSDIPTNNKGNPKIGLFPFHSGDISGQTTYTFSVPLCEFGLDGAQTVCDPVTAYLAAHAALEKDLGEGGGVQTETGWADGDQLTDGGSWAQFFNLELTCEDEEEPPPPVELDCETAFANADNGSETCFIGADFDGDGIDDGIGNWGWSNGPISAGTSEQWPVYAAAGQCNVGNGTLVGYLSVSYDGATAELTFDRVGDFTLDEEHIYVGNDPLPTNGLGEYTVAPGQYPIVVDLDEATQTIHTIDSLSGDIYVVYHAVSCGTF